MVRRYYNLPSLTTLAAFEASARHLSFKNAARELNVTPGAVSRQIKALEAEAGAPLFTRIHRGVSLTAAGEELFAVLSQSFNRTSEVFSLIRTRNRSPSVTIGATTAFASMWLMPRLGGFWRAHPEITVSHQISDRAEDLGRPDIDLRIRYGGGRWPGERVERLFGDVLYPVCGPGLGRQHAGIEPRDLSALPLIWLEGVDVEWIDWKHWFQHFGATRVAGPALRFNNYIIALQAARDDQGIALGWHSLVKPLVERGELIRLTEAQVDAPGAFHVTWSSHRTLSEAATILRDWLSAQAAST